MCFVSVKVTKNADPDQYKYSGYDIGFYSRSELLNDRSMVKTFITFGAYVSWSVHIGNKNKDTLILGEGPIQGSDDTTLAAEAIYPINCTQPNKRFILSLHYNGSNTLFFNATDILKSKKNSKQKNPEIKDYAQCLGNILKDFTVNNMKKKAKRSC